MAESLDPPRAKRIKGKNITAKERVEQFKDEFYEDSGVLFCRFCEHCLDFSKIDTLKDHLKSQKHAVHKQSKLPKAEGSSRQVTLSTLVKAKDMRPNFCLDFIKVPYDECVGIILDFFR